MGLAALLVWKGVDDRKTGGNRDTPKNGSNKPIGNRSQPTATVSDSLGACYKAADLLGMASRGQLPNWRDFGALGERLFPELVAEPRTVAEP
jgi:hypothetical protein